MLDFIIELIFKFLLYAVFQYPGAFIRYLIFYPFNRKKKYKEYLDYDLEWNGVIGIIFTMLIISLAYKYFPLA